MDTSLPPHPPSSNPVSPHTTTHSERPDLPSALYSKLLEQLGQSNPPARMFCLHSDMTTLGRYEEAWLVVLDHHLAVFEAEELVALYPLAAISDFRVEHYYGSGYLEAHTEQGRQHLIRFSRTLARTFDEALEALKGFLIPSPETKEEQPAHTSTDSSTATSSNPLPLEQAEAGPAGSDLQAPIPRTETSGKGKLKAQQEGRCPTCGRALPPWSDTCPRCIDRGQVFRRLLSFVRPYVFSAGLMTVLLFVITGIELIQPMLIKILVDDVIGKSNLGVLTWVVIILVVTHTANAVLSMWRAYINHWLGQRIVTDLRTQLYEHLQRLTMSFYDKRRTGAIMSRITGDTGHLQNFLVNGAPQLMIQVLTLVGIGIILFVMNWKLAAIALLPAPFVAVATRLFSHRMKGVYRKIWRRWASLNATLTDTIPGIRVVKAFTREDHEVAKFNSKADQVFQQHVVAAKYSSIFYPAMGFVITLGSIVVWGYGGYWVVRDAGTSSNLTLGDLMAFINYMWRFYGPVQALSSLSGMFQEASTAAERVFEVLDTEPEAVDSTSGQVLTDIRGEIRFENVWFRYEGDEPVLRDINLSIPAGQMVGLVGSSGAGKTTLASLIPRFYEVSEGRLTIDDVDIREINVRSLRNQIGIVLQEPFLFHGTIAENIAYGRRDATMHEIVEAAKAANAHDFIMDLPDAYDTLIGERGTGLSGGQKQRISIARAILKNPRILILDEATSAVDTETEKLIQEAIERLVQNRTTIAIAHRLSTLKNADRIIVVEHGQIVEEGTHQELLDRNGIFARLWRLQSEVSRLRVS